MKQNESNNKAIVTANQNNALAISTPKELQSASAKSKIKLKELAVVAHQSGNPQMDMPVRLMNDEEQVVAATKLEAYIELYLGIDIAQQDNGEDLFIALQTLLAEQFGQLSVGEVEQAFKLCMAGKLDTKLVAYYNRVTVQMLGDLFASYLRWRKAAKRALAAAAKETAEEQRIAAMQELQPELHSSWIEQIQDWILSAEAGEVICSSWEHIPHKPVEVFAKTFPNLWKVETKKALWEKAKQLAKGRKKADEEERSAKMGGSAAALAKALKRIEQDSKGAEALAKAYYSKLLIWELIKGPALAQQEKERQEKLDKINKYKAELEAAKKNK